MLAPGALLQNRYRVLRLSERNAASATYEAIDQRFGNTVNLKEWEPGGADALRDAFIREAAFLNRHFHVGLPFVYDTFAEAGALYMVSRYIPGISVAEMLASRQPMAGVANATQWLDRILDVLDALHSGDRPVVHGNINPHAIRVTPRGDAVLVDFSFAIEGRGRPLGYTLPYAPYEQIQGLEIDASADLYALAATFYHVLTDQPPPNAYERMSGWANGAPVVLRPANEINPAVPAAVAAVIDRAMALRKFDRIVSATELRSTLRTANAPTGIVTIVDVALPADTDRIEPVPAANDLEQTESVPELAPTDRIVAAPVLADTDPIAPAPMLVDTDPVAAAIPPTDTDPIAAGSNGGAADQVAPPELGEPTKSPTVALDPSVSITEVRTAPPERGPRTSVICRTCGAANEPLRVFCPYCGSLLRADRRPAAEGGVATLSVTCVNCGADNHTGAETCRMCSQALVAPPGFVYTLDDEPTTNLDASSAPTAPIEEDLPPTAPVSLATVQELEAVDAVDGAETLDVEPVKPSVMLAQLLVLEGEEPGSVLTLGGEETAFGRAEGDHTFPLDIFMSGRHAKILKHDGRFTLRDVGSRNGTFLKIRGETPLRAGDVILAGKQLLRFDADDASGRAALTTLMHSGASGASYELKGDETSVGRTMADIVFDDDPTMADTHVLVARREDGHVVRDLGSKNGTFVRVMSEVELEESDIIILGRHIFRFELSYYEDDYATLKGF
jgi:serine/threonine protein kinase/pSer/pThr/pTyr-binding forkhead associated (FHA) protein